MPTARRTALSLIVIFGLFSAVLAGQLVRVYRDELKTGVLTSTEWARAKEQLKVHPQDEQLKEQIRALDARIRGEHLTQRLRFNRAAWLLLAGMIGLIASARWFVALGPKRQPNVLSPAVPSAVRASVISVGVTMSVVLLALAVVGATGRTGFQMAQAPAAGKKAAEATAHQPARPSDALPPSTSTTSTVSAPDAAPAGAFKDNWPCFRGPGNLGLAGPGDYPTTWSAVTGVNILWKTEIPMGGKSSPVVWGDRIFLSGGEKEKHGVMCFDRATGKMLWQQEVEPPADREVEVMEDTGFAASTPATDGQRIYAIFASGLMAAYDFAGNKAWDKDFDAIESAYGFSASLIVYNNLVIVQLDQGGAAEDGKSYLIGIDGASGKELYATPRDVPNSWSSPSIIPTPQGDQLVTCAYPWVIAYDPARGTERWRCKGLQGDVAPSPAWGAGLIFATMDGAQLMAIKPDGSGDVTASHIAWTAEDGMPDTSSPVCDGKRLLQAAAGGFLTCFDAATGKKVWEHYLEGGQTASPIVANGLVYLAGDDGTTRIFKLDGPAFALADRGELGEQQFATPAFGDAKIYIRGEKNLFAIGSK